MASPPKASSAGDIVNQQTAANQQNVATTLNSSNQSGPIGSLNYVNNGNGTWTANQSYSPQEQQLFNSLVGTQGVAGSAATPLLASANYGAGTPDFASTSAGPTADLVRQATNAIIPQAQFAISNANNSAQNSGYAVGSEAYNQAMEPLYQGLGSAISGFEAQFQPTAFNEAMQQYQTPLNTATSLANLGAPAPLNSSFVGAPTVQTSAANAIDANKLGYNQQANNFGGMVQGINSGLSGLGALLPLLA